MTTTTDKIRLSELNKILADKSHGSSEILIRLIDHLIKHCDDKTYILKALSITKNKLSHFVAITSFINKTEKYLSGKSGRTIESFLTDYKIKHQNLFADIFHKHSKLLLEHKVILTISHSKTVINVLKEWRKSSPDIFVYICESRPGMEGLITARELNNLKIKNQIIADVFSGKIISSVDLIILGADQILKDGSIINKIGSRMLAILGKYHKIPVFVLAAKDKIIQKKKSDLHNDNFEIVERKLISKILTD